MHTRLGQRIKYARERRNLNQSELAKKVGMSPQAISFLENRGRSTTQAARFVQALRVRSEWLISDESELDDSAFLVNDDGSIETPETGENIVVDAMPAG